MCFSWQYRGQHVSCFLFSLLYGDQARFFDTEKVPRIKHRKKGTVSMVNNGSDQHGSQVTTSPSLVSYNRRENFLLSDLKRFSEALNV